MVIEAIFSCCREGKKRGKGGEKGEKEKKEERGGRREGEWKIKD